MRVQIVSFHCVLKNNLGELISSSTNQDVIAAPTAEEIQVLPGFTQALKDLKVGEKKRISVSAEQAYGYYNPKLTFKMPRANLAKGKTLKLEDTVRGRFWDDATPRLYRVVAQDSLTVTLDGNHPLAGQDLIFDVEITASREEIETEAQQNKTGLLN